MLGMNYLSVAATALRAPPPLAWPSSFVITTLATSTFNWWWLTGVFDSTQLNNAWDEHSAIIHCHEFRSNLLLEGTGLCLTSLPNGGVHHKNHIVRAHCIADLTKKGERLASKTYYWQLTANISSKRESSCLWRPEVSTMMISKPWFQHIKYRTQAPIFSCLVFEHLHSVSGNDSRINFCVAEK